MTTPTNKQLREFIIATFNESELDTFCFDHFDEVRLPAGIELSDKAIRLIRYCKNRDLLDDLLTALREGRPRQYGRKFGEGMKTAVPTTLVNAPATKSMSPVATKPAAKPNANSFIHERTGLEFMRIPYGEFIYGENNEKRKLQEFWISKTPVTNKLYKRFDSNWEYLPNKENNPVVRVNWYEAVAFCEWSGLELPTEEQWEKAARGIYGHRYPWGDNEPTGALCNFDKNIGKTLPVGCYSPQGDSSSGCVDMCGNIWEWCLNKFNDIKDVSIDKSGLTRILRGGSWRDNPNYVSAVYSYNHNPQYRSNHIGFRVVIMRPNLDHLTFDW